MQCTIKGSCLQSSGKKAKKAQRFGKPKGEPERMASTGRSSVQRRRLSRACCCCSISWGSFSVRRTPVETTSAFARLARAGELDQHQFQRPDGDDTSRRTSRNVDRGPAERRASETGRGSHSAASVARRRCPATGCGYDLVEATPEKTCVCVFGWRSGGRGQHGGICRGINLSPPQLCSGPDASPSSVPTVLVPSSAGPYWTGGAPDH